MRSLASAVASYRDSCVAWKFQSSDCPAGLEYSVSHGIALECIYCTVREFTLTRSPTAFHVAAHSMSDRTLVERSLVVCLARTWPMSMCARRLRFCLWKSIGAFGVSIRSSCNPALGERSRFTTKSCLLCWDVRPQWGIPLA